MRSGPESVPDTPLMWTPKRSSRQSWPPSSVQAGLGVYSRMPTSTKGAQDSQQDRSE